MEEKSIITIIEEVCEAVCDKLCKYSSPCDENCDCDYVKEHGSCPLDRLY